MPVYIRFLQNGMPIRPTARIPVHTPEWTDFRIGDPGRTNGMIPEVGDEVLVGFETGGSRDADLGGWAKAEGLDVTWEAPSHKPGNGGSATLAAQIEFTRPDGRGREVAGLRADLHDVRIVHSEQIARAHGSAPVKRLVIACSRMTPAGAPKSAPDISHQVRARAAEAQAGAHHAGGVLVAMGDGSVRLVR